jgi:pyrroline-5-carboxylate reductase
LNLSDIGPVVLVGAGKMGLALARGWIAGGLPPDRLVLCDPQPSEHAVQFAAQHGIRLQASPVGVLTHVLVIAVKPQVIYEVMAEIQPVVGTYTLVLSIAAGISLVGLSEGLQTDRVIRTMPNTPAQVGRGITGAVGLSISDEDRETANALLSAAGQVMWFDDETKIDGDPTPAGTLRENVTSPKGTTYAALQVLMAPDGLEPLMDRAVRAARQRSEELGRA